MKRFERISSNLPDVCRLGLATRGNTKPTADDVFLAYERGINYWNWCGHEDGMSEAVRNLGTEREKVVVAVQLGGWGREGMRRELEGALETLQTEYIDIVTLYYVESEGEWEEIISDNGAIKALQEAREQKLIRAIGLTSHQRPLAAKWAQTGLLDMLMIRYNAAHRGAELEVFPVTDSLRLPVACFTCLRWGALLKATKDDPPDFQAPTAPDCYRFVLSNPSVSIALMAPDNREELLENLSLLDDWRAMTDNELAAMLRYGDRVHATAGTFA